MKYPTATIPADDHGGLIFPDEYLANASKLEQARQEASNADYYAEQHRRVRELAAMWVAEQK